MSCLEERASTNSSWFLRSRIREWWPLRRAARGTAYPAHPCLLATVMRVRAFGGGFGRRWWQRRQSGDGEQKLVRSIEEVQVGVQRTVGGGQKDGSTARVV